MYRILLFILIIIGSLSIQSCYEDNIIEDVVTQTFDPQRSILYTVVGTVKDTSGALIPNVLISANNEKILTDDNGYFELDIDISEIGSYISAERSGYYNTGIRVYPLDIAEIRTTIIMVSKNDDYSFDNSVGSTINDPSGIKAIFQANNFLKNGQIYNGIVNVNIYWIDPLIPATFLNKPQVYEALTLITSVPNEILDALSMAYISVTDDQGAQLDVSPDAPIQIDFPIRSPENDFPEEVQLLSLNEQAGLWINEGKAIQIEKYYRAFLSHFSWWCTATTFSGSELCIDFTLLNGTPSNDNIFTLSNTDGSIVFFGGVSYDSEVCIPIPTDQLLELRVYSSCLKLIESYSYEGTSAESDSWKVSIQNEPKEILLSGIIIECADIERSSSLEIYYSTELSQDFWGTTAEPSFDIVLDPCFVSDKIIVTVRDSSTNSIQSMEVNITGDNAVYELVFDLCTVNEIPSSMFIADRIYTDVIAKKNPEETLIIANDGSPLNILIGIDGFTEGTFSARLFDWNGQVCQGNVEILKYGNLGETIEGKIDMSADQFGCPGYEGTFIAVREK